jgi:lysyl-tRNA synthetase class 2
MQDFEKLFIKIVKDLNPKIDLAKWVYQNKIFDISPPWIRITVSEAFEKYASIDTDTLLSEKKLIKIATKRGYKVDNKTTWEEIFYQILFNDIEPSLNKISKPYFLFDYPLSQASLSKRKASYPRFAERFEVFLAGIELGNCFSELTDAGEQKPVCERLKKRRRGRERSGCQSITNFKKLFKACGVAGIAVPGLTG